MARIISQAKEDLPHVGLLEERWKWNESLKGLAYQGLEATFTVEGLEYKATIRATGSEPAYEVKIQRGKTPLRGTYAHTVEGAVDFAEKVYWDLMQKAKERESEEAERFRDGIAGLREYMDGRPSFPPPALREGI